MLEKCFFDFFLSIWRNCIIFAFEIDVSKYI